MSDASGHDPLIVGLISEIVTIEQLARTRLAKALPKGMELSHFMVLNHLASFGGERTPAQLARVFHVTRGAMTNTTQKLNAAGFVHIRPDWDDARRKWVGLSTAGREARNAAVAAITPVFDDLVERLSSEQLRNVTPTLRAIRAVLGGEPIPRPPRVARGPDTVAPRGSVRLD